MALWFQTKYFVLKNKWGFDLHFIAKKWPNTNVSKWWNLGLIETHLLSHPNNVLRSYWETQQIKEVWRKIGIVGLNPKLVSWTSYSSHIWLRLIFLQHVARKVNRNVSIYLSIYPSACLSFSLQKRCKVRLEHPEWSEWMSAASFGTWQTASLSAPDDAGRWTLTCTGPRPHFSSPSLKHKVNTFPLPHADIFLRHPPPI